MDVLLLVTAFNGLTQRVWCALRHTDHRVSVALAGLPEVMTDTVRSRRPDLIVCPFLKERLPEEIWAHWRTVIIHPGPVGDRGPSSLDHAISDAVPVWGVTALQAVEEMDAGPIWATRTFAMPRTAGGSPRKSALYNGPISDAAVECVAEVIYKASDPSFQPVPLAGATRDVPDTRPRLMLRQAERSFSWEDEAASIVRRIRAADGAPGVLTTIAGTEVYAYDAHPGGAIDLAPGQIGARQHGALLVGAGDGSVWLGHLGRRPGAAVPSIKLPATVALSDVVGDVPDGVVAGGDHYRPICYRRVGVVGYVTFNCYNGAISTEQGWRLTAALRYAAAQKTRVLVLRGGGEGEPFCNGIHLNLIEAAREPAVEAWSNIRAINAICREIVGCTHQVVVVAYAGNGGAGGVMMGLGADVLVARDGVVLNPYYDIGLYGSELHTFTLPRRVGAEAASWLLDAKLPIDVARAHSLGLVDEVGPRDEDSFVGWLADVAKHCADETTWGRTIALKTRRLAKAPLSIDACETLELAEMARDMFDDRRGFAVARAAFVRKAKPPRTPERLVAWR